MREEHLFGCIIKPRVKIVLVLLDKAKQYGFIDPKEAWWTTVYGEGLDRNQWTRYFLSPMKYNRIVIFRADLWHSHNYNFGDNLENGRIVQLFFFNPTGW